MRLSQKTWFLYVALISVLTIATRTAIAQGVLNGLSNVNTVVNIIKLFAPKDNTSLENAERLEKVLQDDNILIGQMGVVTDQLLSLGVQLQQVDANNQEEWRVWLSSILQEPVKELALGNL